MLKFNDYKYERPDEESLVKQFEEIIKNFASADSAEKQAEVIKNFNKISDYLYTMGSLSSIRHSINTNDKYYEKENEFWDEFGPKIASFENKYSDALLNTKFRKELEKKFGSYLFTKYELQKKVFDESIMEDLVSENKLSSEYSKLVAVGKVKFQGKDITLNDLTPYRQDKNREVRKEANTAYYGYFESNIDKFDEIYDKLVKVRDKMAKKLGYKNFIQMGYDRMGRSDYGPKEVANYRKQIQEEFVPLAKELKTRQKERLNIDCMAYYDDTLKFLTGNATPKGNPEWIMDKGDKMYEELGGELNKFFRFMREHELFDVLSREGKQSGGYCTYIPNYESPFIFANFNGTSHDVDVLTHEAGHAFQVYNASKEQELSEYLWPTSESAEIHSMSMEFIAWPWMNLFFEDDTEKYKFSHLSGAVEFVPYGATIDEFQHIVYENPDMSPAERRKAFRETEKKYLPHLNYDGNEFLENGGLFFRQGHVFAMPFYYIDYTLAQVCALQFWKKSREDRELTMKDYIKLCKAGGSKPFTGLTDYAGIKNPFKDGSIKDTLKPVKEYLDGVEDKKF